MASKKIREELIQSGKLAALGRTVRGVTHEVNNSIAVIMANVEYLLGLVKKEKFSPDLLDSLNAIQEYSESAGRITQGLLDFSREETETQKVDINKAIGITLAFMEKQLEKENIKIIRNFDSSIPEIICNRSQIQQVFLNIILNAKDAMPEGGSLTIIARVEAKKYVKIIFKDTGCGIPEEQISRIFNPNFTTKVGDRGDGLGLTICHEIVEKYGGKIGVKSTLGKGTTLVIKLPITA